MMMKEDIVKQIIKDVGGSENINNAWHCMTRLRFDLKDEKKVDYTALEKIPKVVGTKYQSNQLQVVIGTDVADYYAPLAKELGLDEKNQESSEKKALSRCLWIQSPVYSDQLFQQSLGQE